MTLNLQTHFIGLVGLILLLSACKTQKPLILDPQNYLSYELSDIFNHAEGLNDHLTGFALYDLAEGGYIFNHNETKFFTPASNTKLLTLYAAIKYLPDSIMWMNVYPDSGRVLYEPLGDPSFLHPKLSTPEYIRDYFLDHHEQGDTIYLSIAHFRSEKFGSGWSWDDYFYSYQPELSPFPIHGNVLITDTIINRGELTYSPDWFKVKIEVDSFAQSSQYRQLSENSFVIRSANEVNTIPVIIDTNYYRSFFQSLGLELVIADVWDLGYDAEKKTLFSIPADSVYKYFIEVSDNHIAEQLLLQCAMNRYGVMNSRVIIGYALNDILEPLKEEIRWVDGSGLSRYNLVTPHAMTSVIKGLVDHIGLDRLRHILPAGGKEGTIEDWYAYDPPRVFAKTGTLRYCHNLSGLVQGNSGKWYIFSFMHNNFSVSTGNIKQEMQKVLDVIINKY